MSALPVPALPPEIASRLTTGAALADGLREARGVRGPGVLPTRAPALDGLLGGGLPRGALVEMSRRAAPSCGLFSIALSALAAVTQSGEAAALVDPGDHFDPQAAEAAGADLARLLWLRPKGVKTALVKTALAACETVLSTGFALVVLDLGLSRVPRRRFDDAVWLRLARRARFHDTALLVLSPYRVTGTAAHAVVSAGTPRAAWDAAQLRTPLLTGIKSSVVLEKTRNHAMGGARGAAAARAALRLQLPEAVHAGRSEENEEKNFFLEREEGGAVAIAAAGASGH